MTGQFCRTYSINQLVTVTLGEIPTQISRNQGTRQRATPGNLSASRVVSTSLLVMHDRCPNSDQFCGLLCVTGQTIRNGTVHQNIAEAWPGGPSHSLWLYPSLYILLCRMSPYYASRTASAATRDHHEYQKPMDTHDSTLWEIPMIGTCMSALVSTLTLVTCEYAHPRSHTRTYMSGSHRYTHTCEYHTCKYEYTHKYID